MRKFNKQQMMYMKAKALLATLEAESDRKDREYIKVNKIVNEDGSIPTVIYAIDDQATFDKANAECSKVTNESGLWNKILKARDLVKVAEENLVMYGLSLAPQKERNILVKAFEENYTVRIKLIEMTMKLDPTSVPA